MEKGIQAFFLNPLASPFFPQGSPVQTGEAEESLASWALPEGPKTSSNFGPKLSISWLWGPSGFN